MNKEESIRKQNRLMTERDVSIEFGIPVRTLQKWRFVGGGPFFIKIGRSVRYRTIDIENFIEARVRTSTSDQSH